jgi:RNA methyltransferase, TrmH family
MVVEGQRLVGELLDSALDPEEVYVTSDFALDNPTVMARFISRASQAIIFEVTSEVLEEMSDTVTPQGIVAVLPIPDLAPSQDARFLLIPDQVRDPGNLGTMLRTAWAAGVTEVLLPPGTVDHTNPKVIRAGMGAHFYLPIRKCEAGQIWEAVGTARLWLAEARRGQPYDAVDWRGDVALIIGGEAEGAGQPTRRAADYVHIPMATGVESLNAAVAAAIVLFEAFRQRRAAPPLTQSS